MAEERHATISLLLGECLGQLKSLCQDLHKQLQTTEETRYDLEIKVRKQDYEVRTLAGRLSQTATSVLIADQRIDHQDE